MQGLKGAFRLIFFNEKYYAHNIFRNTFTTKFMWKVVTSSNLNPLLKLFFYSPILTNNNLLLKIYCENVMKILWAQHFLNILPITNYHLKFGNKVLQKYYNIALLKHFCLTSFHLAASIVQPDYGLDEAANFFLFFNNGY